MTQHTNTLDIGIDLDGCASDFVDEYRTWLHLSEGRDLDLMPDALVWDFYKEQWGMTTPEFLETYAAGVRAGYIFRSKEPEAGCVAALERLADAGHRLHIVTARGVKGAETEAAESTAWWLERWSVPHHTLNVVAGPKDAAALELGLDAAIDDAVHHYVELDAVGCQPFLFTRPWNTHHDGRRVHNWDEFADQVIALSYVTAA